MRSLTARPLSLMGALLFTFATGGQAQVTAPATQGATPTFRVEIIGDRVTDFNARVQQYFELRTRLEMGLAIDTVSEDPAVYLDAQLALANRIRDARRDAKQGDLFTREASTEFKRVLQATINETLWKVIMGEDNPGQFRHRINADYPEGLPFATMPANILALLPELPNGLQFRFLGRHLVLYDTKSNVIVDRIPYAIECRTCD
jgi:hypothetical protein